MISLSRIYDFEPDHIFDCGQCFRWTKEPGGSYTGIAGGQIINVDIRAAKNKRKGSTVTLNNIKQGDYNKFWNNYLDMDRDYGRIKDTLKAADPIISRAVDFGSGIRILKQDPWETIISFIISQNNNIPRIKGCIESLCSSFGKHVGSYGGREYYDFPRAEVLASLTVEDLAPVKLGYRAEYIIETSKALCKDYLTTIEELTDKGCTREETYEYLTGLPGVGPKVANCIALFGFGKTEAFPIDTWVKKIMAELYGFNEDDVKGMAQFAEETFGEYGGFAQQYLFYYATHRSSCE